MAGGCGECIGRTPFGSLIAMLFCLAGVGLFCGTLYRAVDITLKGIFEDLFKFQIPWLQALQIAFIIIAAAMGAFAIILLIFGCLATGATRKNVYSGAKCIMGGRVSAAFFMFLTYILNIVWVGIAIVMVIPIFVWVMMQSICYHEITGRPPWYFDTYCFNLTRFGIHEHIQWITGGASRNAICEESELSKLCQHTADSGPLFILAFAGACLIVIGMINYLIALTSNYTRIKISKELSEYRDAVDLEGHEMDHVGMQGTVFDNKKATGY